MKVYTTTCESLETTMRWKSQHQRKLTKNETIEEMREWIESNRPCEQSSAVSLSIFNASWQFCVGQWMFYFSMIDNYAMAVGECYGALGHCSTRSPYICMIHLDCKEACMMRWTVLLKIKKNIDKQTYKIEATYIGWFAKVVALYLHLAELAIWQLRIIGSAPPVTDIQFMGACALR